MKTVYILIGLPGTGKTEAGKYFKSLNIPVVRMGKLTLDYLKKQNLAVSEENESRARKILREIYGGDIYAKTVFPKVLSYLKRSDRVVVDGMRSREEWEYFRKNFDNTKIIYLESEKKIRIKRLQARKNRALNVVEIEKREEYEINTLKISSLKKKAKFVIKNNSNKNFFYEKLKKAVENDSIRNDRKN